MDIKTIDLNPYQQKASQSIPWWRRRSYLHADILLTSTFQGKPARKSAWNLRNEWKTLKYRMAFQRVWDIYNILLKSSKNYMYSVFRSEADGIFVQKIYKLRLDYDNCVIYFESIAVDMIHNSKPCRYQPNTACLVNDWFFTV